MLTPSQLEQIRRLAEEVSVREGCLLYDLEFREGPGRTLRIFIDKEAGLVSLDDCANVSRGLNLRLDVEEAVPGGSYDLEVSSPGLDRRLTQAWHYIKAVGQTVQLRYKDEAGTVKPYEGKLLNVEGSKLEFANAKGPFTLDIANVQKARILLMDVLPKKPAPGKGKGKNKK